MRFVQLLFLFLAALFASSASCARNPASAAASNETSLVIQSASGEHRFDIEMADTDEKRTQGLMYRQELADNYGMLFDFGPEPRPVSMWMKNTLVSLDMAFIRADGVIARIAADTTPRSLTSIPSGEDVIAVLEVKGGRLAALGVKAGDRVVHPLFRGE